MSSPMKIDTIDDFMEAAAEHGLTFKVVTQKDGYLHAIGWPHVMDKAVRAALQAWVDDNRDELANMILAMALMVSGGTEGETFITPGKQTLQ